MAEVGEGVDVVDELLEENVVGGSLGGTGGWCDAELSNRTCA